ncbi:uncharacterized protein LOC119077175 [Bradysia coprophila]|uniref:uncharacterized protein LOC119077175 n=1 Tax=Bradysia coprophila TaxID=38358 RepID=UPI00187D7DA1|nr:uncharacterized protein LOC119077175 [Bradysia coprophila]
MYDNVRQIYSKPDMKRFLYGHLVKDLTFVLYYAVELYHNVFISNTVIKQANNSGLFFRMHCHLNIQLKRSIELLSLQNLIRSPTITTFGLFQINSTILFGVS